MLLHFGPIALDLSDSVVIAMLYSLFSLPRQGGANAGKPVVAKKRYLEPPSSENSIRVTRDDFSFFADRAGLLHKFSAGESLQKMERVDAKCVALF